MDIQSIISIVAQGVGLIFIGWVLVTLVLSQQKDNKFTSEEAAKVIIITSFVFIIITIAHSIESPFNETIVVLILGSILGLAGIDIAKAKQITNGHKRKDNKNSK